MECNDVGSNENEDTVRKESRGLEVIGVGFPRTETSSLRDALNTLGYRCYHYTEMRRNNHADLWIDVLEGKSENWSDILHEYRAAVDSPCLNVYRKLISAYPDARIILRLATWEGLFHGRFEDKAYAIDVYKRPTEEEKAIRPTLCYAATGGIGEIGSMSVDGTLSHLQGSNARPELIRLSCSRMAWRIRNSQELSLSVPMTRGILQRIEYTHPEEEEDMECNDVGSNENEDTVGKESRGLEVIGVGFPRTGTSSLRDALNMLGYRCYHYTEMRRNNHADLWIDVLEGKSENWSDILHDYRAAVDCPCLNVYKKLISAYPNAKIILTVRDSESWYESAKQSIFRAFNDVRVGDANTKRFLELATWEGIFHGRFEDKAYAIDVYERHIEEVCRFVANDKLLIFNVEEGWTPLCNFLGVHVPHGNGNLEFPRSNSTKDFWKRLFTVTTT
eukprot:Gb_02464 [translate_table: standard]